MSMAFGRFWLAALSTLILLVACRAPGISSAGGSDLQADDVGRLYPTNVSRVVRADATAALVAVVREANARGLKVSIAGKSHSQGGHTFYPDAVVLDMQDYDAIIDLDVERKLIRVQSGATWGEVQDYIYPHGLAIKVMQSSNIFTIGGSLSANVHGRDPRFGPLISTVRSFRLLKPDATIIEVSREHNAALFSLAIGGYGLFGVILDVELELTDDVTYEKRTELLHYSAYPAWFERNIRDNPDAGLHYARLSIVPGEDLLQEMTVSTYMLSSQAADPLPVSSVTENRVAGFFYGLSRHHGWGKRLRWTLQKLLVDRVGATETLTRNNAMRPPADFLEYNSATDTDILQEYFIPKARFVEFVERLRAIVSERQINLLSITLRYVPQDTESFLAYAAEDVFAFVLDINQGLSGAERARAQAWTRELVDAALDLGGTYYLTYQLYPSQQQIEMAYPRVQEFFARKAVYDPGLLFMSRFYSQYARERTTIVQGSPASHRAYSEAL